MFCMGMKTVSNSFSETERGMTTSSFDDSCGCLTTPSFDSITTYAPQREVTSPEFVLTMLNSHILHGNGTVSNSFSETELCGMTTSSVDDSCGCLTTPSFDTIPANIEKEKFSSLTYVLANSNSPSVNVLHGIKSISNSFSETELCGMTTISSFVAVQPHRILIVIFPMLIFHLKLTLLLSYLMKVGQE